MNTIPTSKEITAALQPFVDKNYISGAVTLVANKDSILSLDTVGYSDLAAKKPMAPDSVFWIASMTKPMTCAALMMLVDEGKVNVEDPVEKYLPEFKGQMVIVEKDDDHVLLKKPVHPILVREVLSHTSGLPFSTPVEAPLFDMLPLHQMTRSYGSTPLLSEPGTKYNYSNAGTNTAGRIIEVVSGLSYEDFMDQRLLHPLGMTQTTFWPSKEQVARLAKVYRPSDDKTGLTELPVPQLSYELDDRRRHPMPAGGLFSIASDCVKFCQMLLNGGTFEGRRYLSEESVQQMTKKQTAFQVENSYGFGLSTGDGKFGHGGALKTDMTVNPKTGLITVFLIHHTWDWPNDEAKTLGTVFGKAVEKVFVS
jgi:CubicO group peptidase (beta-lactamase class C family)